MTKGAPMKKVIVAAAVIAAFGFVGSANASDLPVRAPVYKAPVMAPAFNWSGVYFGINGGYAWGRSSWTNVATGITTGDFDLTGGMIGGTVGFNYQTGSWVWGIETDLDASWLKGSTTNLCPGGCETQNNWLGTARGRIGYAWDRWMVYGTGGAAFGDFKMTPPAPDTYTDRSKLGWTLGVGAEYAFAGPWSAKLEYLYADLGTKACASASCIAAGGIDVTMRMNIIRAGLNYRFTGF
jgi:outer membrane immunogenic protein